MVFKYLQRTQPLLCRNQIGITHSDPNNCLPPKKFKENEPSRGILCFTINHAVIMVNYKFNVIFSLTMNLITRVGFRWVFSFEICNFAAPLFLP